MVFSKFWRHIQRMKLSAVITRIHCSSGHIKGSTIPHFDKERSAWFYFNSNKCLTYKFQIKRQYRKSIKTPNNQKKVFLCARREVWSSQYHGHQSRRLLETSGSVPSYARGSQRFCFIQAWGHLALHGDHSHAWCTIAKVRIKCCWA